jgi:hypothetical protein
MTLTYLEFDFSEDADGNGSFDARASVQPAHWAGLEAEVLAVLRWARSQFAGAQGSLDAGGEWDIDLQAMQEVATPLDLRCDVDAGKIEWQARGSGEPRITLSLTLSGTPAFCEAFRDAFHVE